MKRVECRNVEKTFSHLPLQLFVLTFVQKIVTFTRPYYICSKKLRYLRGLVTFMTVFSFRGAANG